MIFTINMIEVTDVSKQYIYNRIEEEDYKIYGTR